MIDIEKQLEFDQIKQKLENIAYTEKAKERIRSLRPYLSQIEAEAALRDTTEGRQMLEACGTAPITALEGVHEWLAIASKGGCLTSEQLEGIGNTLTAVKRLKDYLKRGKQYEISLPYYEENLDSLEEIREELNQKIRGGRVDDFASKLLRTLRSSIQETEEKMRGKADQIMKANKAYMSDSFSTVRNGHICIPVKKEYRNKIGGSVLDKSSTGSTLFMEPSAVAKYYEQLETLRLEAENEERRILYTLSAMLADTEDIMEQNYRTIEKLDFVFAKARLSLEYQGTLPRLNTDRYIRLKKGRHPLMDPRINVPLDFQIGKGTQGIIITGPNTGGKTVAIKTVALNCMMAQCGLHTACESADICMNDWILCDIGDGQNLSENLSTFSAHITNVLEILKRAGRESLVVMDELGSGTDPTEGMGIAVAILEELKKSGALFLVTTHYPEVKEYAVRTKGVVNARMTFDKETLKPLYQIVIGEAGESCAFYIAARLGMPEMMLREAVQASYGEEAMEYWDRSGLQKQAGHTLEKKRGPRINRKKETSGTAYMLEEKFHRGDSVMVYPDRKIGIVCEPVNEKGVLRVQLQDKKIWINHKRVKIQVAAGQLYPEDYDFSIIFDTVENRKMRHEMERKYVEGGEIIYHE